MNHFMGTNSLIHNVVFVMFGMTNALGFMSVLSAMFQHAVA